MKPATLRLLAAAIVGAVAIVAALGLMLLFSAVRYDGELIVNIIGLGLLTIVLSVPGALAVVAAVITVVAQRKISAWVWAGAVGATLAGIGAVTLALAAGCVPQCQDGRGSLGAGLLFGVPAGFGVGTVIHAMWRWLTDRFTVAWVLRRVA